MYIVWLLLVSLSVQLEFPISRIRPETQYLDRENATFYTLCRNRDLVQMLETIQNFEDRFNGGYHYDWIFLNDKPFTQEFVERTSNLVSGNAYYDTIPVKYWSYPEEIDLEFAAEMRHKYEAMEVTYGGSESYRHMCRFQSGFAHKTSFMNSYRYYWRVEPGVKLSCNVDYDIFEYMSRKDLVYGFVISIFEYKNTIKNLWHWVRAWALENTDFLNSNALWQFLVSRPDHIVDNNSLNTMSQSIATLDYNLCHFWNNFEIVDMEFLRSEAYESFFNYIDNTGGFFYSRYGDAVIRSIALNLLVDRNQIHWFGSKVGYYHAPYTTCPLNDTIFIEQKCSCNQVLDFTFDDYSCTALWLDLMGQSEAEVAAFEHKQNRFGPDFLYDKYKAIDSHYVN